MRSKERDKRYTEKGRVRVIYRERESSEADARETPRRRDVEAMSSSLPTFPFLLLVPQQPPKSARPTNSLSLYIYMYLDISRSIHLYSLSPHLFVRREKVSYISRGTSTNYLALFLSRVIHLSLLIRFHPPIISIYVYKIYPSTSIQLFISLSSIHGLSMRGETTVRINTHQFKASASTMLDSFAFAETRG